MINRIISIIVPVYNCEASIQKCITSIIEQNVENMEIIVVNDGSNDNTENLLFQLEKQYEALKVISQKNAGVSAARNRGMKEAIGKYVMFIDADDELESGMLIKILEKMEKTDYDLLIGNIKKRVRNRKGHIQVVISKRKERIYKSSNAIWENFMDMLEEGILNSPVGRIFKHSIISKYSIKMNTDLSIGEDLQFNLEYLEHTTSLCICTDILYVYNTQNSYLTNLYRETMFNERKKSIKLLEKHLSLHELNTNIIKYLYIKLVYAQLMQEISHGRVFKYRKQLICELLRMPEVEEAIRTYKGKSIPDKIIHIVIKSENVMVIDLFSRALIIIRELFFNKIQRISV